MMDCPYCAFHFGVLASNGDIVKHEGPLPIVCERCTLIGVLEGGTARKATAWELAAIEQSPAYRNILKPVIDRLNAASAKQSRIH